MKTLINNFISIFRRHKMAASLNILGLSIAFTAFIILMMQVLFDYGYDRFHKNSDRIYRVELVGPESNMAVFPRPLLESFFQSSPHILHGSIIYKANLPRNIAVEYQESRHGFEEEFYYVTPEYRDVFDFRIIAGDPNTLNHPEKVLIPESMAQRFFPDGLAVGRQLVSDELKAEIGGIYRDFPENSIVSNAIYQKIPDKHGAGEWGYHNYEGYILLDDLGNKESVLKNFELYFRPQEYTQTQNKFRLTSLPDVYYLTDVIWDSQKSKGSRVQIFILTCIAFLILFIAAVNFSNFSNALVPMRLKGINTHKVLGCSSGTLRISMLIEAIVICITSFGLALIIVYLISDTRFNEIISGGINLSGNVRLIVSCALIAIATGLIAGSWPAWYITSFSPALVLKGNYGLSPEGKKLRGLLVGVQFVFTFILMLVAVFVYIQNNFMIKSSLGFDKDQLAVIKLNDKLTQSPEIVRTQLLEIPEIDDISMIDRVIGGGDEYSTFGGIYEGEKRLYQLVRTDIHIFKVLGIKVHEGREFIPEDYTSGALIFSEKTRNMWGLELGEPINEQGGRIVGFMKDFKYNSYRNEIAPFAFYIQPGGGYKNHALIRINAGSDYTTLVESVEETLTSIDPDYPLQISLYDQIIENLYKKEILLGNQIFSFSMVAIFISLIGVIGIVMFESQYKRREISIRKVFGSTIKEVVLLLNNQYIKLLICCFVLASPIAYYAISNWLQNFANKTPIYLWVFLFVFVAVTSLTLFIVTLQNWWVARINPLQNLKAE